jgi:hypothetical protein
MARPEEMTEVAAWNKQFTFTPTSPSFLFKSIKQFKKRHNISLHWIGGRLLRLPMSSVVGSRKGGKRNGP